MIKTLNRLVGRIPLQQDMFLVAILVLTLAMMVMPVPTVCADVLIVLSISIATLLMMVAIYIRTPVEFSTLPSVILITTAFRLALSITTARMVLVHADAGAIIQTFGNFVVAGNVVVGLVIYLIISIVQFVVITKGSERVAEVAARFSLDALPGQQVSIDADLRNGDINQGEARRRRNLLQKESQLYGSMDGAMKFVKGDAIASLVIIVINLVGGITIGCLQHGMDFATAVNTYSLLAVGDGLIAQIPALLISLTAGIVVTRISSEDGHNLGRDIVSQMAADVRVLYITAGVLAVMALVPGFPMAILLGFASAIGGSAWLLSTRRRRDKLVAFNEATALENAKPVSVLVTVHLGAALDAVRPQLAENLQTIRTVLSTRIGIAIPPMQLALARLDGADAHQYRVDVDGVPTFEGAVEESVMADPANAIARMAEQSLLKHVDRLIGIQETKALVMTMEPHFPDLVRESLRVCPLPRLSDVLRLLVAEQVPVSHVRPILETVAEWAPREQSTGALMEHVREALRRHICHMWSSGAKVLHGLAIEALVEESLRRTLHVTPKGMQFNLDQATTKQLVEVAHGILAPQLEKNGRAVILAAGDLRRPLWLLLRSQGIDVPVLSFNDVAPEFSVQLIGTISPVNAPVFQNPEAARSNIRLVA